MKGSLMSPIPRTRVLVVLLAVAALLVSAFGATGAQAARVKVTGGTTTVTPAAPVVQALTGLGVTVAPIAPATAANGTLTFPIVGGRVNTDKLRGVVRHSGGLKFSKGERCIALRHFTVVSTARGAKLYARVSRGACRVARVRTRGHKRAHRIARRVCKFQHRYPAIARLTDPQRSTDGTSVTVNLKLTAITARIVNKLAGQKLASPGTLLGTATIAPTTE
jgi:hypothetical protein